jgi:hypothetical protein
VLLAKDETALNGTIEKITGSVRCCGMKTNVGKTKKSENHKANVSSTDYDRKNAWRMWNIS